jgi:hypothetical protein
MKMLKMVFSKEWGFMFQREFELYWIRCKRVWMSKFICYHSKTQRIIFFCEFFWILYCSGNQIYSQEFFFTTFIFSYSYTSWSTPTLHPKEKTPGADNQETKNLSAARILWVRRAGGKDGLLWPLSKRVYSEKLFQYLAFFLRTEYCLEPAFNFGYVKILTNS